MKYIITILLALVSTFSQAATCDHKDPRACAAFNALVEKHGITTEIELRQVPMLAAGDAEIVLLNTGLFRIKTGDTRALSNSAVIFMIAHEFGHFALKNVGDEVHEAEFAADEFAAKWMMEISAPDISSAAAECLGDYKGSRTHPSSAKRISRIRFMGRK